MAFARRSICGERKMVSALCHIVRGACGRWRPYLMVQQNYPTELQIRFSRPVVSLRIYISLKMPQVVLM